MANERILIFHKDEQIAGLLEHSILDTAGYVPVLLSERKSVETLLRTNPPEVVILGSDLPEGEDGLELAASLLESNPSLQILLLANQPSDELILKALRTGVADCLFLPLNANKVLQIVRRVIKKKRDLDDWALLQARRHTKSLQQRVSGLEALQNVSRKVAALLNLDEVLAAVVEAAVNLTGAEEGSLLLVDETSGELYMRASKNFQEDFAHTFRMPVQDSLPGQVIRSGEPILIDAKSPRKIKTSYLVHTLIYVPMKIQERVIGVLGVDNRQSSGAFNHYHQALLTSLADYAAIAIENARLYSTSEAERAKLETLLSKIQDGVIVLDHDNRLLIINRTARAAFGLGDENLSGKTIQSVLQHSDLLEILRDENATTPYRREISLEDGRFLNAQVTPIPEVGLAVTMQDITYLKDLDRIKSDFVNAVSHDLRSPLTAILGYVELIERIGPVNSQQSEFIKRIQLSVHNITALINDLLDLGRIEAGFDSRKDMISMSAIIPYALDGLQNRASEKAQSLVIDVPDNLPQMLGNPIHIRQMLINLVSNALKYTQAGGEIVLRAHSESEQIILQVKDNGPGIPAADQPYVFDKFYRASNVDNSVPGTGLGLSIVKSIVENHGGRIWVESSDSGTSFTVVLPTQQQEI